MKSLALILLRILGRTWCRIQGAEVDGSALIHGFPCISCKRGGRVVIGEDVTLNIATWSNPINDHRGMRIHAADGALVRFAKGSGASNSRITAFAGIEIGEDSLIGSGCLICDSDMHALPLGAPREPRKAPIRIGKRVFIGANCTILKGVSIGDGAVVGANSVVTRNVPAGVLVAGNPAVVRAGSMETRDSRA